MATPRNLFGYLDQQYLIRSQAMRESSTTGMIEIAPKRFAFSGIMDSTFDLYMYPGEMLDVPVDLNTPQALVFLGLSEDEAAEIYRDWLLQDPEYFDDLYPFAQDRLEDKSMEADKAGTGYFATDWVLNVSHIRLSKWLFIELNKPNLDEARPEMSGFEWAMRTMDVRWRFLLSCERASRARDEVLARRLEENRRS